MKIVKASEMARIEHLAFQEGISEESCMENAGRLIAEATQEYIGKHHLKPHILLLCGRGNNGGDAYVAGRHLLTGGFAVSALALAPFENCSPLCQLMSRKFIQAGGQFKEVKSPQDFSFFAEIHIILDGILGTGFHGQVKGLFYHAIERANATQLPILAIDIPSGINGTSGEIEGIAIKAKETLFLGLPKSGCFLGNAWEHVGKIRILDFGLQPHHIEKAEPDFLLLEHKKVSSFLPTPLRVRHKYQAGYVVGVGGSPGMPGAPLMTSFAALRAGAGIVRLLHPKGMESELVSGRNEIIREPYQNSNEIVQAFEKASAVFMGPGMGTSKGALKTLKEVLPQVHAPCVLDAEALTLFAKHDIQLPKQVVLTPHHGEMKRLLNLETNISIIELLKKSKEYAQEKNVTLVLKGAPTFIFHPGHLPYVCPHGDPGMATAGSGDILTGIIAGLLAQIKDPLKAALLGVDLHARAGEYAAEKWTSFCMVAEDILDSLPTAFKTYTAIAE